MLDAASPKPLCCTSVGKKKCEGMGLPNLGPKRPVEAATEAQTQRPSTTQSSSKQHRVGQSCPLDSLAPFGCSGGPLRPLACVSGPRLIRKDRICQALWVYVYVSMLHCSSASPRPAEKLPEHTPSHNPFPSRNRSNQTPSRSGSRLMISACALRPSIAALKLSDR